MNPNFFLYVFLFAILLLLMLRVLTNVFTSDPPIANESTSQYITVTEPKLTGAQRTIEPSPIPLTTVPLQSTVTVPLPSTSSLSQSTVIEPLPTTTVPLQSAVTEPSEPQIAGPSIINACDLRSRVVVTRPLKFPRLTCDNGFVKKGLLCYQNCPNGYRFNNETLPVSCIPNSC